MVVLYSFVIVSILSVAVFAALKERLPRSRVVVLDLTKSK